MYGASVPVALQAIAQALRLAEKATPDLLAARLHPDMWDCAQELHMVADFALRATYPLTVQAQPDLPEGDPVVALKAARAAVNSLTQDDFAGAETRRVQHQAGFADLDQGAQDYLQHFAIPNLWFNLSMAFAILRKEGVEVGKADVDGLHSYPQGFCWED